MSIQSFNNKIEQLGAIKSRGQPIYGYIATALGANFGTIKGSGIVGMCGRTRALPTLPSGITGYYVDSCQLNDSAVCGHILAKLVDLGSFDISGSGTFTDGSGMPTVTQLGVASVSCVSPILVEVTTAISYGGSCNITVNYTDQDGNSGSTAAISLATATPVHQSGWLTLASGDWAVRDITSVTRSGSPTSPVGIIQFWGAIPLGFIQTPWTGGVFARSGLGPLGLCPVRLGAGDSVGLFRFGVSGAGAASGWLNIVGDN